MTLDDLYLIAHKVRGEAAFDVAIKIVCSKCQGHDEDSCTSCEGFGHWWIIPTSGHRAYPWWSIELADLGEDTSWAGEPGFEGMRAIMIDHPMPDSWPDHYASPSLNLREPDAIRAEGKSLLAKLLPPRKPLTDRRL